MGTRTERIEMRLTEEEKEVIHGAAELVGADTPGGWARTVVLREARKILRENRDREEH